MPNSKKSLTLAAKGLWMRSGEFAQCRECGTSERPHMAKGFCRRCYENHTYNANLDREHRKRKAWRLATDDYAKRKPKVDAWHAANADKVRTYKREYARKHSKWQIGIAVWFWYDEADWKEWGHVRGADGKYQARPATERIWVKGKIVARDGNSVVVSVYGRGRLLFGVRRLKALSFSPEKPVEKASDTRTRVRTALGYARIIRSYRLDGAIVADVEMEKTGKVVPALHLQVKQEKRRAS